MTRIFFLINSLENSGGTERVSTLLANHLSSIPGVEVTFCTLLNSGKPFFSLSPAVSIERISNEKDRYRMWKYPVYIAHLRELVKRYRPRWIIDVCSAMSLLSIPACAGTGCRVITWEHFNTSVTWNGFTAPLARRLASEYASTIVTLTQRDVESYRSKYGARHVTCIPNPVTLTDVHPSDLSVKTVLSVGRLSHQKGFDMLLDAWSMTSCRNQGWQLHIVGDGEEHHALSARIQAMGSDGNVTLHPSTTDISRHYRNASIYVMSSRFEGMPLVLIEAMAHGLPAISFDCPNGPAEIIREGITGHLIPPDDVAMLAQAIDRLASSPASLGEMSAMCVRESQRYSPAKFFSSWEELLGLC